jgi:hypothetical protein
VSRGVVLLFRGPEKPGPAPSENAIKIFYQSPNWEWLAREVKDERGSKCECCGATSREMRIVTDHIKPIKHHWHLRLDK